MKLMYYVLKSLHSKHGPIINTWTTFVQTLESHRLDINIGDVLLKLQEHDFCWDLDTNVLHWQEHG